MKYAGYAFMIAGGAFASIGISSWVATGAGYALITLVAGLVTILNGRLITVRA